MKFFIPHLKDGSTAEEAWAEYLGQANLPGTTRPIRALTYEHEGSKYVVVVGEPRKRYREIRGPRGGRRPGAGYQSVGEDTGTDVTAIADADPIRVWSMPPYRGWGNPSFVGRHSLTTGPEHFETR